ncbi:hypothetical protein TNCV_1930231 [Trichonephila clavipes]|nr:hypothetical protein TNCV_1930231 [Trichonephila clavipes]
MTRSRLASLTVKLYGIPDVLDGSSRRLCGRWCSMEITIFLEVVICHPFPKIVGLTHIQMRNCRHAGIL